MKFSRIKKAVESPKISLSKVGSIRCGEKVAGRNRPTSLDYFVAKSDYKDYVDDFTKAMGEKPNKIRIYFLSNDIAEICPNILELRDASGKLVARGDGENFEVVAVENFKGYFDEWQLERITSKGLTPQEFMDKLAAKHHTDKYKATWREVLRLRFMVAGVNLLGYWELTTYAEKSSIPQIIGCIDSILDRAGFIMGIPFDLCVKKVKSDKSGVSATYPVISLLCNFGDEAREQSKHIQAAFVDNIPLQIEAPKG